MTEYTWLIIAGILLTAELLSGTFYLLMLSISAVGAWLSMKFGADFLTQTIFFLVCAAILTALTRRYRHRINSRGKPNVAENLDAGHMVSVHSWHHGVGQTHYRGAQWSVELDQTDELPLKDGMYRIVRLDGPRIRVERVAG